MQIVHILKVLFGSFGTPATVSSLGRTERKEKPCRKQRERRQRERFHGGNLKLARLNHHDSAREFLHCILGDFLGTYPLSRAEELIIHNLRDSNGVAQRSHRIPVGVNRYLGASTC